VVQFIIWLNGLPKVQTLQTLAHYIYLSNMHYVFMLKNQLNKFMYKIIIVKESNDLRIKNNNQTFSAYLINCSVCG